MTYKQYKDKKNKFLFFVGILFVALALLLSAMGHGLILTCSIAAIGGSLASYNYFDAVWRNDDDE